MFPAIVGRSPALVVQTVAQLRAAEMVFLINGLILRSTGKGSKVNSAMMEIVSTMTRVVIVATLLVAMTESAMPLPVKTVRLAQVIVVYVQQHAAMVC